MKVIANYPDLASAELAKSILVARGIPAWIPDSNLAGIDWRLGTAIGGIRLQVEDENENAATELLDSKMSDEPEIGSEDFEPDEVCPYCNSTHIGPDDQRRLKMLTLLFLPVSLFTIPKILLTRNRIRCGDCGKTWRDSPAGELQE